MFAFMSRALNSLFPHILMSLMQSKDAKKATACVSASQHTFFNILMRKLI